MSAFRLSHRAERDLDDIATYIADRNPSAAIQEVERLSGKFLLLAGQPLLGEVRNDLPGCPRALSAGNYLILYRPVADGIEVARMVHAARDISAIVPERA